MTNKLESIARGYMTSQEIESHLKGKNSEQQENYLELILEKKALLASATLSNLYGLISKIYIQNRRYNMAAKIHENIFSQPKEAARLYRLAANLEEDNIYHDEADVGEHAGGPQRMKWVLAMREHANELDPTPEYLKEKNRKARIAELKATIEAGSNLRHRLFERKDKYKDAGMKPQFERVSKKYDDQKAELEKLKKELASLGEEVSYML